MENTEVKSLVGADSRTIAEAIVKILDDKKARDIKLLKVDEKTTMTDYFVVCTATSTTQVKSLCGEVEFQLGEMGLNPAHSDGITTGNWAALDYLHVIVHIFLQGERDFYKLEKMRDQARIAIETADVIAFMCNVHDGVTPDDREIASMLQRSGKPIIPVINKIDTVGALPMEYYEFYELGFDEDPIPLSSIHGTGTGDLLDKALELCPPSDEAEEEDDTIKVAVIGKPNAGKSSIVNRILGEDRMIVSDIAGTTRDAINSYVENDYGKFTFIDTAGIRRQSKVEDRIEKFSVLRAKAAVEKADVCLIMIDATEGITEQDEKIAGLSHEAGKAAIIVINKWDLVEKDNSTVKEFTDRIRTALSYMPYAPILFVSAKTGQRVDKVFEQIVYVNDQSTLRVSTGMLNDVLSDAMARVQPPTDKGRRLKIYYMTQTGVKPPEFVIFCNSADLFHFSYQRYIENNLRDTFGFNGTPIKIIIRQKGDNPQ